MQVALDKGEQNALRVEAASKAYSALSYDIRHGCRRNSLKQKYCMKVRKRIHSIMKRTVGFADVSRKVRHSVCSIPHEPVECMYC